jgi:CubicO group peptidase (beta-lactamase class C family)
MTLGQFFARYVAAPLGADHHIGTGPECDHRIASFIPATPRFLPQNNPIAERVGLYPRLLPSTSSSIAWRRAEVGGANGHGNARSVATILSALACGSANGVRLLSDATRHRVLETQTHGIDLLLGVDVRWGMGFALECVILHNPLGHRVAGWGGQGGSLAFVDFDARMSVGYVMNRYMDGPAETARFNRVLGAVYQSLAA